MGVKNVCVSPNQYFMIASFFDTKIKVFNCLSQKEITIIDHPSVINLIDNEY